jgi:hypothetical protein
MRKLLSSLLVLVLATINIFASTGTPSTLSVRVDANGYLVVTSATQTNPITSGTFSSRVLRTDASGNLQVILAGTVTPTYPLAIPASTCAAPSLGESGAVTTGIAFTATPGILMCIAGSAIETITGSSITSTKPYIVPSGAVGLAFGGLTSSFAGISNSGTQIRAALADGSAFASFGALNYHVNGQGTINVTADGAFRLLDEAASLPGQLTGGKNALTTTSTDGSVWQNTTAALVGTQVQISPRVRLSGTGWDTDDAVSRNVSFFTEVLPVAGNTVTGTWKLGFIDPVSSALTYPLTVSSAGTATFSGTVIGVNLRAGASGNIDFGGSNASLQSGTNGLLNITNQAVTVGVQINTGTAAPTVTSCGTGTIDSGSRNSTGGFIATGATACTVTFGAPNWTNTPTCVVTLRNIPVTTPYISAISTTAFTVSGLTANDSVAFHCLGRI